MFNYNAIKARTSKILNQIVNSGFGSSIIYKKFSSSTFDPSVGANTITYDNYEIKVIPETVAMEISGNSSVLKAIGYSAGEKRYYVPYPEMPRNPNDKDILKDKIVDNGTEYKIKKAIPYFEILVILQV